MVMVQGGECSDQRVESLSSSVTRFLARGRFNAYLFFEKHLERRPAGSRMSTTSTEVGRAVVGVEPERRACSPGDHLTAKRRPLQNVYRAEGTRGADELYLRHSLLAPPLDVLMSLPPVV